jgi:hypothetical protein
MGGSRREAEGGLGLHGKTRVMGPDRSDKGRITLKPAKVYTSFLAWPLQRSRPPEQALTSYDQQECSNPQVQAKTYDSPENSIHKRIEYQSMFLSLCEE